MDHRDSDIRLSSRKRCVQPSEVVLNIFVFFVPGRLISDRRRIIALSLTGHRGPGQMRDPDGHSECRLPVSLQLMSSEIKIIACDAVEFAHDSRRAELMCSACCLLRGREFPVVAEHVNARYIKAPV